MSNKIEKSFEERLHSLKIGCIIFGVIEIIAIISALYSLSQPNSNESVISLVIAIVMLAVLYFMYKYTSEKDSKGPILEYIFGGLMLIEGIIYCITLVGIIFGVIFIVLSVGILKEASYFKKYIEENKY
jgi:hypothetical protein